MNKDIKVCFVCTGNTCRSIMAERLLKKLIKDRNISNLKVCSKGVNALGENIAENAKIVLKECGANFRDRKSVRLKKIEKDVLYVAMTEKIKQNLNLKGGKAISIKDLISEEIDDPYGQNVEVYRNTLKKIEYAENVLIDKILKVRS